MRSTLFYFISLLSGIIILSCSGPKSVTEESPDYDKAIVASFGDSYKLTARQLGESIFYSTVQPEGGTVDEDTIRKYLDSLLVDTLAGMEANNFNFDSVWIQAFVLREEGYNTLINLFWERVTDDVIQIDSSEVIRYYNEHPDVFHIPEQVDLYHILLSPTGYLNGPDSINYIKLSTEQLWDKSEKEINKLYQIISFGEDFQNVAFDYSQDITSQPVNGRIGWTKRGMYLDPFDSIAFSLSVGTFSKPYKDENGWHLLYVDARLEEGPVAIDFPGTWESAYKSVLDQKKSERIKLVSDSLYRTNGFNLVYNELYLDSNVHSLNDSIWAGVLNDVDTVYMRRLKQLERLYRKKYNVASTIGYIRREMISDAAGRFLFVQGARELNLDKDPRYVKPTEKIKHGRSKNLILLQKYGDPAWSPANDSLEKYYRDHEADFIPKHHLYVIQMITSDSALAEYLREQAITGYDLYDMAEYWRKEEEQDVRYQDLGIIDSGDVPDPIFNAANNTMANHISQVIRNGDDFHVLKVISRRNMISMSTAKPEIRLILKKQYQEQQLRLFRDKLYLKYGVKFPVSLKSMEVPMRMDRTKEEDN